MAISAGIKGREKSTPCSLAALAVSGPMATTDGERPYARKAALGPLQRYLKGTSAGPRGTVGEKRTGEKEWDADEAKDTFAGRRTWVGQSPFLKVSSS